MHTNAPETQYRGPRALCGHKRNINVHAMPWTMATGHGHASTMLNGRGWTGDATAPHKTRDSLSTHAHEPQESVTCMNIAQSTAVLTSPFVGGLVHTPRHFTSLSINYASALCLSSPWFVRSNVKSQSALAFECFCNRNIAKCRLCGVHTHNTTHSRGTHLGSHMFDTLS